MADILTPTQQQLLRLLFSNKNFASDFYLTGGTALAVFYLNHRYSEDLDLFSEEEVDTQAISVMLKAIQTKINITHSTFTQSFNRNIFFLHFPKEIIKTEFTYFPFASIEKPMLKDNLRVDSLIDIAVNKTFTICQNPRLRDFIDLYLILTEKKWTFDDVLKKSRVKFDTYFDPIQISQQLLKVKTLKDYPRMITKLKDETWQDFWISQARLLKRQAIKN